MKNLAAFILLILFSFSVFPQKPARRPVSAAARNSVNEKDELEKAISLTDASQKIAALQKFIADFPKSAEKNRALESIAGARAALADEKLQAGEREQGIELFTRAIADAPDNISDKLFAEVIVQIPTNLFVRGERDAAMEIARVIESKIDGNAKQTLTLAAFYLGTENADEAKRLAEKAVALDPGLPAGYQTLGLANRLNFNLEDAAAAYQKALEIDANSIVSKRSLAEMKRAVGKPSEAAALYREILEKDAADGAARTGLILALFDADKTAEAESEMQKFLDESPNNLFLLTGAAYHYAAKGNGAKAIELGEKAIAVEPRYTWAHIALARGLILQKRFAEAEKTLLYAAQYGNFPTLDYEIAAARFQSGFYREAAEGLRKSFVMRDRTIETRLGGRVVKNAKDFIELLDLERRASIFEPLAADASENAERMKSLLDFSEKLDAATDDAAIGVAVDEFVKGNDKWRVHRQLFAASQLLARKQNSPKVLELAQAAISGVDAALDAPNPASFVLADELYDSRKLAMSRGELIIVPEVSRATLSSILRGRIEDAAGGALLQENKSADAVIRLKRAVSVLPEKSSWWRSAMWRLGTALEADGKSKDALDAYIKSYQSDEANAVKYGLVESLYQKVNGNTDGLEAKIGAKPASPIVVVPETVAQKPENAAPKSETAPEVKPEEKPQPTTDAKAEENSLPPTETKPATEVSASPEIKSETNNESKPASETNTEKKLETKIEAKEPEKTPAPDVAPKPLFEPIIITVPKVETAKKTATEDVENESSKKVESKDESKPAEINQEKKTVSEIERPRVVVKDNLALPAPCIITANQNSISISRTRGSLGVLVGFDGAGDVNEIRAVSSSPNDVQVTSEPEIGALSGRAFFVIKSVSRKTGEFTVAFEAPCGKREISVRVR